MDMNNSTDSDDSDFYRHHICFKHETLQWLADMKAGSPEDEWIARLDGDVVEEEERLPAVPSLDGIHDDLIWMFRCRESGLTWKAIAEMLGLQTAAGAWKKYGRLLAQTRKKLVDTYESPHS